MIHLRNTSDTRPRESRRPVFSQVLWTVAALPVLPGALVLMGATLVLARCAHALAGPAPAAGSFVGTDTLPLAG